MNDEYRQIYDKGLEKIFDENNVGSLDEINKIVVNETIKLFGDKISEGDKEYDSNVRADYDNLFAERMKQNDEFKNHN